MTELEAKILDARLTKIWGSARTAEQIQQKIESAQVFRWALCFDDQTRLFVQEDALPGVGPDLITFDLRWHTEERTFVGALHANTLQKKVATHEAFNSRHHEDCQFFVAQWMPFFRRGCWLSGCPLEASAHEKMEWIQGYSREETEDWNLDI